METKLYKIETFEPVDAKLNNLPRKPGLFTADEIVAKYIKQINNAIQLGYSFKEIAGIFNETGCKISANALKTTYEKIANAKINRKKNNHESTVNHEEINNGPTTE